MNQGYWILLKVPVGCRLSLLKRGLHPGWRENSVPDPAACLGESRSWQSQGNSLLRVKLRAIQVPPSFVGNGPVLQSDSGSVQRVPGLGVKAPACSRGQTTLCWELGFSSKQGLISPGLECIRKDVNTRLVNWKRPTEVSGVKGKDYEGFLTFCNLLCRIQWTAILLILRQSF